MIFSCVNTNSIRNKFGSLCSLISSYVDILSIAETKLDYSILNAQFLIPNFHQQFPLDINRNSERLLVFVRSSIPARMLSDYRLPLIFQLYHLKFFFFFFFLPFEINQRKEKWLTINIFVIPYLNFWIFIQVFTTISLFLVISI